MKTTTHNSILSNDSTLQQHTQADIHLQKDISLWTQCLIADNSLTSYSHSRHGLHGQHLHNMHMCMPPSKEDDVFQNDSLVHDDEVKYINWGTRRGKKPRNKSNGRIQQLVGCWFRIFPSCITKLMATSPARPCWKRHKLPKNTHSFYKKA